MRSKPQRKRFNRAEIERRYQELRVIDGCPLPEDASLLFKDLAIWIAERMDEEQAKVGRIAAQAQ